MGNLVNLLVYISPTKTFSKECDTLSKIQVDNSIELGWRKEDIVFVTNFPWEYNGVKATVVGDEHYYSARPRSIKTAIIPFLIDEGIIEKEKIYWNHDFDAYQLNTIEENDLGLDNFDAGLTDYGWKDRWCMGSFFVKSTSKDIFMLVRDIIYKDNEDESAMLEVTRNPGLGKRCKRLNITYNFGMRHVESNFERAIKPLKVAHFHPWYPVVYYKPVYSWKWTWDIFLNGKNKLNMPLVDKRLKELFNQHGISEPPRQYVRGANFWG